MTAGRTAAVSTWFPETDTHEGARRAARGGFYGALGFAATIVIGLLLVIFGRALPGQDIWVGGQKIGALIAMLLEPRGEGLAGVVWPRLVVVLVAAARFRQGKGLYVGGVTLLLHIVEMVVKFVSSFSVGGIFIHALILLGLVNGLRGAWAYRQLGEEPAELEEVFR